MSRKQRKVIELQRLFKAERIIVNSTIELKRVTGKYKQDLFELYSDDENTWYMMPKCHECMEDTELYLQKAEQRMLSKEAMYFGIICEPEDKLIGLVVIHSINAAAHGVSLGYMIRTEDQRKNITYQCSRKLIEYIFENTSIVRIGATTHLLNQPSQNLLRKLNFQEEGILRKYSYNGRNGQIEDRKMFSIIKE